MMSQGREAIVKRGPGRPPRHPAPYARLAADSEFKFKTGDLVLVKWTDGMVYFAKIKKIDHKRQKCAVVFDDKSQDEAHFKQIHSGKNDLNTPRTVIVKMLVSMAAPCVYGTGHKYKTMKGVRQAAVCVRLSELLSLHEKHYCYVEVSQENMAAY